MPVSESAVLWATAVESAQTLVERLPPSFPRVRVAFVYGCSWISPGQRAAISLPARYRRPPRCLRSVASFYFPWVRLAIFEE